MTAEDKIQVTWRVVVRGEASPRLHVFDEGWLLNSWIGDADIVRCNSPELKILAWLISFRILAFPKSINVDIDLGPEKTRT